MAYEIRGSDSNETQDYSLFRHDVILFGGLVPVFQSSLLSLVRPEEEVDRGSLKHCYLLIKQHNIKYKTTNVTFVYAPGVSETLLLC